MWQRKSFLVGIVLITLNINTIDHGCEAGVQVRRDTIEDEYLANGFNQSNSLNKRHLTNDQTLLVRLPTNPLLRYTAYKDISILHFRIPHDTRTALFMFKAFEESKSAFPRSCKPRSVTVHLKASSYPVISPENIEFPKNFLDADQRLKIYDLDMLSNDKERFIEIEGPKYGNWFAIAYISWTDPNKDRIEQQGLTASCETILFAEMSIIQFQPIIINANELHENILTERNIQINNITTQAEIIYKFFVPHKTGSAKFNINFLNECKHCAKLSLSIRANAFPLLNSQENVNIYSAIIAVNELENLTEHFDTQPNSWHYMLLRFDNSSSLKIVEPPIESADAELEFSLQLEFMTTHKNIQITMNSTDLNKYAQHYNFRNIQLFPLLRQTYREFFTFDYDLLPDENGSVPLLLNLTAEQIVGFSFDIGEVYDIGGTLSFALTMKNDEKFNEHFKIPPTITSESEHMIMIAEKLIWMNESVLDKSVDNKLPSTNQTIIVCLHLDVPGSPIWPDKCQYGNKVFDAAVTINNTDLNTGTGIINIPFPESGRWYITMGLFCPGAQTTARMTAIDSVKQFVHRHVNQLLQLKADCACFNDTKLYAACIYDYNCLYRMPEAQVLKLKECLMDSKCTDNYKEMSQQFQIQHKTATEQQYDIENCNASVVFSLSSSPCVSGRCGRFGRCFHYMSGGFVFSTCICMTGYRGWDCSEDALVPTKISLLMASLLLTLSNLLFLPSIYTAIKRTYYTEAVIYFFAMFFSIFYHACDSGEDEYTFCLVTITVLQFCDFYCGLLAIWVTLVAMSHIQQQLVSLLHMFGAIALAFGTELDKQSLWVFLAPALTGICIISVSWGFRCHKSKNWFPSREYLSIYLPLGAVLVMVGLVCYAFLQTKQNYHIVHSIWHMLMALSLLCLLPKQRSCLEKS